MNYRHAFHAGNFADVLKHATLALALQRLTEKPKPLRVIDTHAGIGRYRLDSPEASRTGEWKAGIGRLLGPDASALSPGLDAALKPYLDAVRAQNPPGRLDIYPGSPAVALALMRPPDRLMACEMHPEDATALRKTLRGDRRAKVLQLDGWQGLRALLPPPERRGLVLIDPPFEEPGELERLVAGLAEARKRFATGVYIVWLPIKDYRQIESLWTAVRRLAIQKAVWVELRTETLATADHLAGAGLLIINPPFGLTAQLAAALPPLADRLSTGDGSAWDIRPLD